MSLEVSVEWKHIKGSEVRSTCQCPIARALNEQHRSESLWYVGRTMALQWPGKAYRLPPKAVQFIGDLLDKRPVSPFTFILETSDEHDN